jgi:hypothetical protein
MIRTQEKGMSSPSDVLKLLQDGFWHACRKEEEEGYVLW